MAKKQEPRTSPAWNQLRKGEDHSKDCSSTQKQKKEGLDLYLVRHADAGERRSDARMDMQRPLSPKGREDARKLTQLFKALDIEPGELISSPLPRALETATIISRTIAYRRKPRVWKELSPGTPVRVLTDKLSTLRGKTNIILVGHEPSLTGLLKDLVGSENGIAISLRKGGVARIKVTMFTPRMEGELRWLLSPKLLKRVW